MSYSLQRWDHFFRFNSRHPFPKRVRERHPNKQERLGAILTARRSETMPLRDRDSDRSANGTGTLTGIAL
ncbi:hypothetical protein CEXT_17151 [Caerostris extrusa]|uniref:Ycf15 n=1 Tax=Caerostris extrusa TaxID=172846 RepID=A0AAV4S326_CAEEX|nr:hypothetical protein CEXT_17151 [Caerostris extrusa]